MRKFVSVNSVSTWAAIIGVMLASFAFFDDFHTNFATKNQVSGLMASIDECVTKDELTIVLLKRGL